MAKVPGYNYKQFVADVLKGIGAPQTFNNEALMAGWLQGENTSAGNNPLATTQDWNGATDFNSSGVKNYATYQDGVSATVKTITNGRYIGIVADLQSGTKTPSQIVNDNASEFDTWGTGAANVAANVQDKGFAAKFLNNPIGDTTSTLEKPITSGLSDVGKYVAYGAAFLGGSLLILLGIVLIGADIGLAVFARTKTANTGQKVVGAFGERKEQKQQREYRARTSERAEAIGESKRRTQAHRETLAKARTRTERARARNIEGTRPKPAPKRNGEVITGDKKSMTVIRGGQAERHSSNGTEFGY